ncbi:hypothetical protein C2I18_19425 [Paenibacillus sp. PK3_47]|uniref:glycoside hydrolase family 28 protein n=1 Tax=Paenibacillus sp. PK3_47 TaxID=2072642 RepID=UPI00201D90AA|nr:glycosyl hydrolase family 28-related protein [Paenibacillus sp. PK3_47]UQZ35503.1 hypothetical protein C2I18_19425 [Paenibacillus sp. PK3_47]
MFQVTEATGCPFGKEYLLKEERKFDIRDYGAGVGNSPAENTKAINDAIKAAAAEAGTVVIPEGNYRVYTIRLLSGVNLYLSAGSVLSAARTDIRQSYVQQTGEGGNYEEPEVNLYAGLQDHGHTYFANSLIYGADIRDVMIYGPGLLDGSSMDDQGELEQVLLGGDPEEPVRRNEPGHRGEWFGNKAVALVRCENVALCGFSILAGGHFAIITTCVKNLYVERILVDTNRDALDVDCCENVTIVHSTFNSLTDDAIVLKASYGGGIFMPLRNVLIEDCLVCGYDVGSVFAKTYTTDKLIATDRCGPTARVKLGTESTCGYDCVTVRRVEFKRSRGFALEAVDGADLSNIIFEDSTMEDVSSSPIFIKAGDRGRFPVTGNSTEEELFAAGDGAPNVRLDQPHWMLPAKEPYQVYPARRYLPSYNRTRKVSADGSAQFYIVDPEQPCRLNPANYHAEDGKWFAVRYDELQRKYVPDYGKELQGSELPLYANANGSAQIASVRDIVIRNITARNVDPRYPVELMGLTGSRIRNISISNVTIEYRGGLSLEHAVEQRQLNTSWEYTQYGRAKRSVQPLPWLVNTFFLKNEGLLPRAEWDPQAGTWKDAPFNVPELPEVYPEPSNWGILPAYGLYARHVDNLHLDGIELRYLTEDTRYPIVLDDIVHGSLRNIRADHAQGVEEVVIVRNLFKRPAGLEYVPGYPYHPTGVEDVAIDGTLSVKVAEVAAPAPGTPKDTLYSHETAAIPGNGYHYPVRTADYPVPQTVFRPFFASVPEQNVKAGETLSFGVLARQPAFEASARETDGRIYNETVSDKDPSVRGIAEPMTLTAGKLPEGAVFEASAFVPGRACMFSWTPPAGAVREEPYIIEFIADDGILPVTLEVSIKVSE